MHLRIAGTVYEHPEIWGEFFHEEYNNYLSKGRGKKLVNRLLNVQRMHWNIWTQATHEYTHKNDPNYNPALNEYWVNQINRVTALRTQIKNKIIIGFLTYIHSCINLAMTPAYKNLCVLY